jgi:hypothetical protein
MPEHQHFHVPMQFLAVAFVIFAIHEPKYLNLNWPAAGALRWCRMTWAGRSRHDPRSRIGVLSGAEIWELSYISLAAPSISTGKQAGRGTERHRQGALP